MQKWISFLLIIIMLLANVPVLAEDISEKSVKATVAPTATPQASSGEVAEETAPKSNVVIVVNNSNKATSAPTATPAAANKPVVVNVHSAKTSQATKVPAAPTATPIPAAEAVNYIQDPITFGEGSVVFYSNEDNAYCKRSNYQVVSGSAVEFAKAYAEACKNNPYMTYLKFTTSPTGWNYYCFDASAGNSYTSFTTSSGDWSTGNMCFSISCKEDSQFITLRWSFEMEMGDLGYRRSVPIVATPTAVPAPTATPIPAAESADYIQDPITFGEGSVVFYSNEDSAYCNRSNYQVMGISASDFAKAYAEACKNNPNMNYLEYTTSPSGWNYYCFTIPAGANYTPFTNLSGDWTTPDLCFSISCKESSQYIALCWSFELQMGDLGYRHSATNVPAVQSSSASLEELKQTWLCKNPYYYNQLSEKHKKAWETIVANVLTYPNQKSAPSHDAHYQALAPMLRIENPRIFWIQWTDSQGLLRFNTGTVSHYDGPLLPEGKTLADLQQTFLAAIPQAVAQIQSALPANATTRDTVKAIHDWICQNNRYNTEQRSEHITDFDPVSFDFLAAHSAYSAIIPGDAYEPVCDGYASAFQLLCEEFGIQAICVSGVHDGVGHRWNYVKMDDEQWYLVDVDVDDLASSYNYQCFLLTAAQAQQIGYNPDPYLTSGVTPENGYTEGAAFTLPTLAQ